MERAFARTGFPGHGPELTDVTRCLYANTQRRARAMLEQSKVLRPREKHKNGAEWVFWAEGPRAGD
jgi:hypothetical protein